MGNNTSVPSSNMSSLYPRLASFLHGSDSALVQGPKNDASSRDLATETEAKNETKSKIQAAPVRDSSRLNPNAPEFIPSQPYQVPNYVSTLPVGEDAGATNPVEFSSEEPKVAIQGFETIT